MSTHVITTERQAYYDAKYLEQQGLCAICARHVRLVVDHDHKTGESRGLLCYRHNTGLGMFEDSPEFLERAANYLRTSKRFTISEPILSPTYRVDYQPVIDLLRAHPEKSLNTIARLYHATMSCSFGAAKMRLSRIARKYGLRNKTS